MKKQIKFYSILIISIIILSLVAVFSLHDVMAITNVFAANGSISADESVSTYSGLSAAIGRAPTDGTPYTIAVSDEVDFTGTLTIASGKNVILKSDANGRRKLIKSATGRHFTVNGTLTLINIIMDGNWDGSSSGMRGGVQVNGTGAFYLNDGAVIENCRGTGSAGTGTTNPTAGGGGIGALDGSKVGVNGGIIRNNTVTGTNGGGGVYIVGTDSVFTMENGIISGNRSTTSNGPGGGVSAATSCTVTIKDSTITNNEAVLINGGGVSVGYGVKFTMTGGTISLNKSSAGNGGGVYASSNATLTMTDVTVSGNTATGYGGGVGCNTSSGGATGIHIESGRINDNRANYGGGIHLNLTAEGTVSIGGSEINGNIANTYGGGIYLNSSSSIRAVLNVNDSSIKNNTASTNGGGIYTSSYGTISVNDSTISGNVSNASNNTGYGGGGVYGNTYSEIIMNNSIVNGNKTTSCGGGVFGHSGSKITVNGGTISGNSATRYGGGVYGNNSVAGVFSTITVNDAVIGGDDPDDGNTGNMGGGIALYGSSTYIVNGSISRSTIKNNTATTNGGGVYLTGATSSTLDMSGCEVSDNKSNNGGGIYITNGILNIKEDTLVDGNEATNHGGGIYITNHDNITTASDTRFSGNRATVAYRPPDNAAALYPNIGFASVSIADHPLNNYDINYIGERLPAYHIIYDANGGTGSYTGPEILLGGTDTVLSVVDTGISRMGYEFTEWNTVADGTGTAYAPGDLITLYNNITLYAQWTAIPIMPEQTEPPTESGQETLPPTEPPTESGQETLPPTEPPTESGQKLPELGSK